MNSPRIIVPLDFPDAASALRLVQTLDPALCRLKIGKELFTRAGPSIVERCMAAGFEIFLDLKFHDIPNTVAGACRAAADMGVWMVNVHASGGRRMLQAAREAIDNSRHKPLLTAVTVLTSLSDPELQEIGINASAEEQVIRLAKLAQSAGVDGVVCSARETMQLRLVCGNQFCLVTPGIRPAGAASDDQKRIVTPAEAVRAGSDYLVIGRPVTKAADPVRALNAITQEITAAL